MVLCIDKVSDNLTIVVSNRATPLALFALIELMYFCSCICVAKNTAVAALIMTRWC